MNTIPNVHEYLMDHRPCTTESVHQTSVASSDEQVANMQEVYDEENMDSNRYSKMGECVDFFQSNKCKRHSLTFISYCHFLPPSVSTKFITKGNKWHDFLFFSLGKGIIPKMEFPLKGKNFLLEETRPQGYKTFFMLNSTEHEFFPAHKC